MGNLYLLCIEISRDGAFFHSQISLKRFFFPLINVQMQTIVGILTFKSRKNFVLSGVEHEKSFIISGPAFIQRWRLLSILKNFISCFTLCVKMRKQASRNHLKLVSMYSQLSLSRSRRDHLKHFEISVLRHIRYAKLSKIQIEQPNFSNKNYVIWLLKSEIYIENIAEKKS